MPQNRSRIRSTIAAAITPTLAATCGRAGAVLVPLTAVLLAMAGSAQAGIIRTFNVGVHQTGVDSGADGSFESFDGTFGHVGYDSGPRGGTEYRYAFEFDLAGLPAGASIDSAALTLRTGRPDFSGQTRLSGYLGNGAISLADMSAGGAVLTFTPVDSLTHAYDVSSFVQGAFGPGQSWIGFNLRQWPLRTTSVGFGTWNAPVLTVQYTVAAVPEPQAYLLVLTALGVMAGVTKRRRSATPRCATAQPKLENQVLDDTGAGNTNTLDKRENKSGVRQQGCGSPC